MRDLDGVGNCADVLDARRGLAPVLAVGAVEDISALGKLAAHAAGVAGSVIDIIVADGSDVKARGLDRKGAGLELNAVVPLLGLAGGGDRIGADTLAGLACKRVADGVIADQAAYICLKLGIGRAEHLLLVERGDDDGLAGDGQSARRGRVLVILVRDLDGVADASDVLDARRGLAPVLAVGAVEDSRALGQSALHAAAVALGVVGSVIVDGLYLQGGLFDSQGAVDKGDPEIALKQVAYGVDGMLTDVLAALGFLVGADEGVADVALAEGAGVALARDLDGSSEFGIGRAVKLFGVIGSDLYVDGLDLQRALTHDQRDVVAAVGGKHRADHALDAGRRIDVGEAVVLGTDVRLGNERHAVAGDEASEAALKIGLGVAGVGDADVVREGLALVGEARPVLFAGIIVAGPAVGGDRYDDVRIPDGQGTGNEYEVIVIGKAARAVVAAFHARGGGGAAADLGLRAGVGNGADGIAGLETGYARVIPAGADERGAVVILDLVVGGDGQILLISKYDLDRLGRGDLEARLSGAVAVERVAVQRSGDRLRRADAQILGSRGDAGDRVAVHVNIAHGELGGGVGHVVERKDVVVRVLAQGERHGHFLGVVYRVELILADKSERVVLLHQRAVHGRGHGGDAAGVACDLNGLIRGDLDRGMLAQDEADGVVVELALGAVYEGDNVLRRINGEGQSLLSAVREIAGNGDRILGDRRAGHEHGALNRLGREYGLAFTVDIVDGIADRIHYPVRVDLGVSHDRGGSDHIARGAGGVGVPAVEAVEVSRRLARIGRVFELGNGLRAVGLGRAGIIIIEVDRKGRSDPFRVNRQRRLCHGAEGVWRGKSAVEIPAAPLIVLLALRLFGDVAVIGTDIGAELDSGLGPDFIAAAEEMYVAPVAGVVEPVGVAAVVIHRRDVGEAVDILCTEIAASEEALCIGLAVFVGLGILVVLDVLQPVLDGNGLLDSYPGCSERAGAGGGEHILGDYDPLGHIVGLIAPVGGPSGEFERERDYKSPCIVRGNIRRPFAGNVLAEPCPEGIDHGILIAAHVLIEQIRLMLAGVESVCIPLEAVVDEQRRGAVGLDHGAGRGVEIAVLLVSGSGLVGDAAVVGVHGRADDGGPGLGVVEAVEGIPRAGVVELLEHVHDSVVDDLALPARVEHGVALKGVHVARALGAVLVGIPAGEGIAGLFRPLGEGDLGAVGRGDRVDRAAALGVIGQSEADALVVHAYGLTARLSDLCGAVGVLESSVGIALDRGYDGGVQRTLDLDALDLLITGAVHGLEVVYDIVDRRPGHVPDLDLNEAVLVAGREQRAVDRHRSLRRIEDVALAGVLDLVVERGLVVNDALGRGMDVNRLARDPALVDRNGVAVEDDLLPAGGQIIVAELDGVDVDALEQRVDVQIAGDGGLCGDLGAGAVSPHQEAAARDEGSVWQIADGRAAAANLLGDQAGLVHAVAVVVNEEVDGVEVGRVGRGRGKVAVNDRFRGDLGLAVKPAVEYVVVLQRIIRHVRSDSRTAVDADARDSVAVGYEVDSVLYRHLGHAERREAADAERTAADADILRGVADYVEDLVCKALSGRAVVGDGHARGRALGGLDGRFPAEEADVDDADDRRVAAIQGLHRRGAVARLGKRQLRALGEDARLGGDGDAQLAEGLGRAERGAVLAFAFAFAFALAFAFGRGLDVRGGVGLDVGHGCAAKLFAVLRRGAFLPILGRLRRGVVVRRSVDVSIILAHAVGDRGDFRGRPSVLRAAEPFGQSGVAGPEHHHQRQEQREEPFRCLLHSVSSFFFIP